MPVVEKGRINSLSSEGMTEFEKNVTRYEQLARKIVKVDRELKKRESVLAKRGGIYSSLTDENYTVRGSLPSSFVRKQRKLEQQGLAGGRLEDQKMARNVSINEKIRPEIESPSMIEGILQSIGLRRNQRAVKGSLVSGAGRPVRSWDNEFTRLRDRVLKTEQTQKALATSLTRGQALVQGAAGLASPAGLLRGGLGAISSIHPIVATVVAVAVAVVSEHTRQYGPGGPRDRRKKVQAEDTSAIGIDNENIIASGHNLFFSNPATLQGLPHGLSNTINLRNGIERYEQRHQGSY